VKKYVDKEDWNVGYKPRKKRASKLEPLMPIIDEWLTEDIPRKRKNKRTAVKIYSDLSNHPEYGKLLDVGRQTILNYVNKKKAEIYSKTYQTAMFTRHAMCEAQVDFGDVTIVRRNKSEEIWHILVVSFPWSNAGFGYLCRNETKECLCEGLQRIFEYIGGVPLRILFDKAKQEPQCGGLCPTAGGLTIT
jgi:transposase